MDEKLWDEDNLGRCIHALFSNLLETRNLYKFSVCKKNPQFFILRKKELRNANGGKRVGTKGDKKYQISHT